MMALSYDEMQQLFEQKGFKGFSMRPYDTEMEYLLSEADWKMGGMMGLPCWKNTTTKSPTWIACIKSG